MGRVESAVCAPSGQCLPKDAGGRTHAPVPPRGASTPPAFLQQSAPTAGDREGGAEDQQPRKPCYLCAI